MDQQTKQLLRNYADAYTRHSKAQTTADEVAPGVVLTKNPYERLLAMTIFRLAKTPDPTVRELLDRANPFKQAAYLGIDPENTTADERKQVLAEVAKAERELVELGKSLQLQKERKEWKN